MNVLEHLVNDLPVDSKERLRKIFNDCSERAKARKETK
jgi:hypothetical protein